MTASTTDSPTDATPRWHVSAAIAAWLLPGLGHVMIGQRARGLIIGITIMAMWTGGLALGGVSVIDTQQGRAWFLGQMLVAPSVGVLMYHNHLRQRYLATQGPQPPVTGAAPPAYEPAYGRMAETGTLYTALAGMMNLLAMIDVIYRDPKARRLPKPVLAEEPV